MVNIRNGLIVILFAISTLFSGAVLQNVNVKIYDSTNQKYTGVKFTDGKMRVVNQEYLMAVAEGDIAGHSLMTKLGNNPDIDDVQEDVWEVGGTYVFPTVKQQMHVISTSAQDSNVATATGIKQIIIHYLDSGTFTQKYDTVGLDGRVAKLTTATDIYRINFVEAYTVGTGLEAAGTIDIRSTAGATPIYARISAGYTRSRQAIYTVPGGKTLYVFDVNFSGISIGTNGCRFITRAKYTNLDGGAARNFFLPYSEVGVENGSFNLELHAPTKFVAGTDIKVSAIGTSASASIIAIVAIRGWLE